MQWSNVELDSVDIHVMVGSGWMRKDKIVKEA